MPKKRSRSRSNKNKPIRFSIVLDDWAGSIIRLPRSYFQPDAPRYDLCPLGSQLAALFSRAKSSLTLILPAPIAHQLSREVTGYFIAGRSQWPPPFSSGRPETNLIPGEGLGCYLVEALWRSSPQILWQFDCGHVKFSHGMTHLFWKLRLSWNPDYHPLNSMYAPPTNMVEEK